jgi:hypothetical protein
MAFVQAEQLESPSQGKKDDRGSEEDPEVEMQLASLF